MGIVADADGNKPKRPYHAPRRKEQARRTRERIIAAATTLFRVRGYAVTTVRAIAAAARVSVPTVELAFGTKPQLLRAVIDVAIAGDDEPVAVLQRDWARKAEASGSVAEFLAIVGQVLRAAATRAAGLVVVAYEAAPTDPEIKALTQQQEAQRAITVGWIVDGVIARAPLRAGISRSAAVDTGTEAPAPDSPSPSAPPTAATASWKALPAPVARSPSAAGAST
jgi:AcrR family transcriptional regulator